MLNTHQTMDGKWQHHPQIAPNCPRCSSTNTKFCYYNNYSLSQPRFFCKSCRRYWTKGGSLRNVPVGGGCRKSRRAKSARLDHRSSSSYSPYSAAGDKDSGGAGIDLAAVFANFLNQDPKSLPESSVAADSLTSDSDTAGADFRPPMGTGDVVGEFPKQDELSEFGLQSLLGDELVQDALWSEATASDLSSCDVTWQPEEFVSLIGGGDQVNIPANLVVDNVWSSFDLSGF